MKKRGSIRNLCVLMLATATVLAVSGCGKAEPAAKTEAATEATSDAAAVTEAASGDAAATEAVSGEAVATEAASGDAAGADLSKIDAAYSETVGEIVPEVSEVHVESTYLDWTLTDEFDEQAKAAGELLINWDEASGTGTILVSGDSISQADIKELIFYSAFGTYSLDQMVSPEGVSTESFSGTDQVLTLPEMTEDTALSLVFKYELTQETHEFTITIQP